MKEETQKRIFELLEPVVEFIKEELGVDAKPAIFRGYYGAIRTDLTVEELTKLSKFLEDNEEVQIFDSDATCLKTKYIVFSFTINGKWSHAWE